MEYWKTYQKDLILQCLNHTLELTPKALLWQQIGEVRNTFMVHFEQLNKTVCVVKIEGSTANFDSTKPFYIRSQDDQVIFKKDHYNFSKDTIEFAMPGIIQVKDKRKIERFYYLYQDHKIIRFHSEELEQKTKEPVFSLECILVDISISGAGIVVDQTHIDNFKLGQKLILDSITDQKLPDTFKVKVTYINEYHLKNENLYKIGLEFDDSLDSVSFKSISKIVERKQLRTAGLSQATYCGLSTSDQKKMLYTIEKKNPVLSKNLNVNIEYLDRLRYMTPNMKVEFLQVMDHKLLAIALRLSSKELVYDLFNDVSERIQKDFLDLLKEEKPASAVCKTQDQIIKEIREMEKTGKIILNAKSSVTYV